MKTIKQIFTGARGEISSKRVAAFCALTIAAVGFFLRIPNFEPFLWLTAGALGITIFEGRKQ